MEIDQGQITQNLSKSKGLCKESSSVEVNCIRSFQYHKRFSTYSADSSTWEMAVFNVQRAITPKAKE